MKVLHLFFLVGWLFVDHAYGYCFMDVSDEDNICKTVDGSTLMVGEELTLADRCEKCSCHARVGQNAALHCCGYGIHAGVIMPPPGCEIKTGEDGCSVEIVRIDDGNSCMPII